MKRYYTPDPPEDYTAQLEEMFGPGFRMDYEDMILGPGSDRPSWLFCQELYRLDEWARTGVEPPPVGWFTRLIWRIEKWIYKD